MEMKESETRSYTTRSDLSEMSKQAIYETKSRLLVA